MIMWPSLAFKSKRNLSAVLRVKTKLTNKSVMNFKCRHFDLAKSDHISSRVFEKIWCLENASYVICLGRIDHP